MMPTIKTEVDADTYAELVRLRREEGVSSVSALFLKKCGVLTDAQDAEELVKRAVALARRRPGRQFRLRDLFSAQQWERFGKGTRIRAGRLFFERVNSHDLSIEILKKTASNHQLYRALPQPGRR
jgi:hypothetical protein